MCWHPERREEEWEEACHTIHTPYKRFGCRWETSLCDPSTSAGEHILWLCEHYQETWASWYHLAIQIWWWVRHSAQFGAHPTAQGVLPAGRSWAVPDSAEDQSEADGQCLIMTVTTNNFWPFLYSILSLIQHFHTESGVHPTRLWNSWSVTWKLDLMHCWITTLHNFSACSAFSRWDVGLSQPLATSKIKIKTTLQQELKKGTGTSVLQ